MKVKESTPLSYPATWVLPRGTAKHARHGFKYEKNARRETLTSKKHAPKETVGDPGVIFSTVQPVNVRK